jgi:hydrogenase nickel incorporation protein HypB
LTKTDLLPYLKDFDPQRAERYLRELATDTPLVSAVANDPAGIDGWLQWLRIEISAQRDRVRDGKTLKPKVQPDGTRLHGLEETSAHDHSPHHHHHHQHSTPSIRGA